MRISRLLVAMAIAASALTGLAAPAQAQAPQGVLLNTQPISAAEALRLHSTSRDVGTAACYAVYFTSLHNGRYVSAEMGYTGNNYAMLRARATAVGPWEKFGLCFGAAYDYAYSLHNGRYVSAEMGFTGNNYAMLRARATAVGPWEKFRFNCPNNCYFYFQHNARYVSAEMGYTGNNYAMLRARATSSTGPWEKFS